MSFPGAPPTPTKLGVYRQLAPRAGIHVSPLVLGAMSLGDKWTGWGFGAMSKEDSFKYLDAFFDAGGNFIDTASNYQDGASEMVIGEWAEHVHARGDPSIKQYPAYVGNHVKNLKLTLETSLKRLRTSYVDILYLHYWDLHTDVEEIMDGLHNLFVQGKVLYLGKANDYARQHGKTPFVVYQAAYSVLQRDIEREILPMCHHEGIALTLWNVLAEGHIRSDEEEARRRQTGEKGRHVLRPWERTPDEKKMCDALEVVRKQVSAKNIQAVAIAYTMHKAPYVFPIFGGRKVEHLHANIEALSVSLTKEQINYIDGILPFEIGFPHVYIGQLGTYPFMMTMHVNYDAQPLLPPIPHTKS
ncbi:aryl-alcohol dehydrogenase [Neolentinus lepideus HHB14362 ss-1]|uniref:Aryl-alcohol dehydrogenase n=1 Tax=Neolentinus lepideus HHB14362 ss-1 TaxID=1314782 RepID=A0A165Q5D4_9AGAM|nr:aryl-alcohol dehydrogenase [Neolentinus lepideus HHB14362 ss-1]